MDYSVDYEKLFFHLFLHSPVYFKKVYKNFFTNGDIDFLCQLSKNFYEKYKESPSKEQLKALVSNVDNKSINIDDELIDIIFDVNLKQYEDEWLRKTAEAWITWKNFDKQLFNTVEFVKLQDVTPDNVVSVVQKAISMLTERGMTKFDNDLGLDFFNPEDHLHQAANKMSSGKDFIDRITGGGYDTKSLVVWCGQANVGKSIFLANEAVNFVRRGINVAFISAEMAGQKVIKRIGSNLLNIPMSEYDQKSYDRAYMARRLERVGTGVMPPGKLFVKQVPTSQFSVLDMETYLRDLEDTKGIKLKVIIVDYINILANYRNANSENTYMKIKQISEDLRGMAVKNDWLIISATQISKQGWSSTDITMDKIAESAGLAHTADMLLAIIQDEQMHFDKTYWVKILKIRDGEGKDRKCKFEINYEYMRLTETSEVI